MILASPQYNRDYSLCDQKTRGHDINDLKITRTKDNEGKIPFRGKKKVCFCLLKATISRLEIKILGHESMNMKLSSLNFKTPCLSPFAIVLTTPALSSYCRFFRTSNICQK